MPGDPDGNREWSQDRQSPVRHPLTTSIGLLRRDERVLGQLWKNAIDRHEPPLSGRLARSHQSGTSLNRQVLEADAREALNQSRPEIRVTPRCQRTRSQKPVHGAIGFGQRVFGECAHIGVLDKQNSAWLRGRSQTAEDIVAFGYVLEYGTGMNEVKESAGQLLCCEVELVNLDIRRHLLVEPQVLVGRPHSPS